MLTCFHRLQWLRSWYGCHFCHRLHLFVAVNARYQRRGPVSFLTGYVSANGHRTWHQPEGIVPCGDDSIDVKGTEVNSVNSLKIKHLRAFGQPSEGCLDTRIFAFGEQINRLNQRASWQNENGEGWVDRKTLRRVEWIGILKKLTTIYGVHQWCQCQSCSFQGLFVVSRRNYRRS